jgi:hypothetical protein
MPIQYYVYISDEKVEMLAGQLRRGAGEVLSGWKVNVGPVGVETALRPVPSSRYKQIEKIRRHILSRPDCGTIDEPRHVRHRLAAGQVGPVRCRPRHHLLHRRDRPHCLCPRRLHREPDPAAATRGRRRLPARWLGRRGLPGLAAICGDDQLTAGIGRPPGAPPTGDGPAARSPWRAAGNRAGTRRP